jgi:hypothetical protein
MTNATMQQCLYSGRDGSSDQLQRTSREGKVTPTPDMDDITQASMALQPRAIRLLPSRALSRLQQCRCPDVISVAAKTVVTKRFRRLSVENVGRQST